MNDNGKIIINEVDSPEAKEDLKVKIVVIGDSGVGKTNLIKRFITNTFDQRTKSTVGVEFITKTYKIKDNYFKVEIWDTAGQERYKSITSVYYKGAKGALVVYDITSKLSFGNIEKWMNEIREKTSPDLKLMLIGNKVDLTEYREVPNETAMQKAKEFGIAFMETSALDATNVKEAFYDLLREIYKQFKNNTNNNDDLKGNKGIDLDTYEKKKKVTCCNFL